MKPPVAMIDVCVLLGITLIAVTSLLVTFWAWRSGKRLAWRRGMRPFPVCPQCRYAMRGLTHARCPECGTQYTLEELWTAQRDFDGG